MKKIVYTRPDGGLSVVHPSEGARLAHSVTLADGTVLKRVDTGPIESFLRAWPVAGASAEWAETEDAFIARVRAKDVPADATGVQVVEESAIPADRAFRNAWMQQGAAIQVHMGKAREIHKDRLRALRAPLLARLDVEYQRADESGDLAAKAAIAKKKQALRDVTAHPAIEAAMTPEQLKTAIPDALKA